MRLLVVMWLAGCGFSEVKTDLGGSDGASPAQDLAASGIDLATPVAHARVFISHDTVLGDMNTSQGGTPGLAGADALCQHYATVARLGTNWRAWLSDSSSNAIDRVRGNGPWYRTDDVIAFPDRNALSAGPMVALDKDEAGVAVPLHAAAWSATSADGVGDFVSTIMGQGTCSDWTANDFASHGFSGDSGVTDGTWTDGPDQFCNSGLHLYCFESD